MDDTFLLSVVIPNRNRAESLLRAVLSLRDQTGDEIEIIVVDDCSDTDLSAEYALLESMGVRVLRQDRHLRGSAARNRGAAEARGSHISFLDSDDLWLPGRYDRIKTFYADPANARKVLVSGAVLHVDGEIRPSVQPEWPEGSSLVEYVYRDGGRIQTSMLTMPAEIAREYPFDESLRVNQDTDLAMRLDRGGIGFVISPEPALAKEETPRKDRLTTGHETIDLSYDWFRRENHDWSGAAKSGYYLQDRVWRLADAGRRREAFVALMRTLSPPVAPRETVRRGISMLLGERGYALLRRGYRKASGDADAPREGSDILDRWNRLDREAVALAESARESGAAQPT
ncbi:glycosyltransferase family 2 protein [Paracoccus aurantiacus]|uniref:Glycosyltransferase family 2 protein n=1 Tax=Paracoccus aurantiacus TaxID=2599412 RepID=A0A5C6RYM5_9RHOB|nr:glycosyltransferase family 2 protein [Paracoccus aurantiacus]TXB67716.1 glycosyltransferase family 2 protein [Paracoccus aurantiacus]